MVSHGQCTQTDQVVVQRYDQVESSSCWIDVRDDDDGTIHGYSLPRDKAGIRVRPDGGGVAQPTELAPDTKIAGNTKLIYKGMVPETAGWHLTVVKSGSGKEKYDWYLRSAAGKYYRSWVKLKQDVGPQGTEGVYTQTL